MKLSSGMFALGAVSLALLAAACGSGTSSSDKTSTAAAGKPANPTAVATQNTVGTSATTQSAGGAQKQLTITAVDFSFSAPDIDVSKGDTINITFKNNGSATHTLSFFSDENYTNPIPGADTGAVSGGGTKQLTVTADKGLYYRCNIHPTQMMGEIEIK